ncbi:hypothetical protein UFOVP622_36 [uncultured Caudovirales phage]|uniref:Uncharacterized protein n=1 Tax=uncultured Caudovirales phage TaxID=2100421 RepID=A0A6J5N2Y4_9CAUD|nr:hypothetical protein UFOVP622_36 [uncultured Caudovirales phage]
MKTEKINYKGTEINKVNFYELEELLEEKGIYKKVFNNCLNEENDCVYISNGFLLGLTTEENTPNEWHHYFIKQLDGSFECEKLNFN